MLTGHHHQREPETPTSEEKVVSTASLEKANWKRRAKVLGCGALLLLGAGWVWHEAREEEALREAVWKWEMKADDFEICEIRADAERGYLDAQTHLAVKLGYKAKYFYGERDQRLHEEGREGLAREARDWLERAAEGGDAQAQALLGEALLDESERYSWNGSGWSEEGGYGGVYVGEKFLGLWHTNTVREMTHRYPGKWNEPNRWESTDNEEARRWIEASAGQGYPYGLLLKGLALEHGYGGRSEPERAYELYEAAHRARLPRASCAITNLLARQKKECEEDGSCTGNEEWEVAKWMGVCLLEKEQTEDEVTSWELIEWREARPRGNGIESECEELHPGEKPTKG